MPTDTRMHVHAQVVHTRACMYHVCVCTFDFRVSQRMFTHTTAIFNIKTRGLLKHLLKIVEFRSISIEFSAVQPQREIPHFEVSKDPGPPERHNGYLQ